MTLTPQLSPRTQPGGPGGQRGPRKLDPKDRTQLKRHPVSRRRILELFAPHRAAILTVVVLITASSIVNLAQPFLLRAVLDEALPQQRLGLLGLLTGGMVLVAAITALIGVVQTWLSTKMGQQVMHTLRVQLFTHVQSQSMSFFTKTRSGEVQSRLMNDISGMQQVVTTTATGVAANLTTVVATLIAMIVLSPALTLLSLLVLPPAIWLSRKVAFIRRAVTDERQQALAELHTQVEERLSVSGARLAKTLGTTQRDAQRFEARSEALIDLEMRSQLAGRWRMATMQIVFAAIPAIIYFTAGLPVASAAMTIGTLVAFTTLQAQIFRPLMSLLDVGVQWVTAMAFFSRIFEYLDLKPDVTPPVNPVRVDPQQIRGSVRFEQIDFTYDHGPGAAERKILEGIDMSLPAGSTVAIVGATGSGKSTLAALLPRLYDPTAGRVLIDDIDVRDIAPEDLASLVGVVSQETYLVHDTVRQNLLLAKPQATDDELWAALEYASVADTIRQLPQGLDTLVGARGHRFSGGEQQRLAIARTLLRNPPILVLDEATSALDNTTETHVQQALDELAEHRTTLMIAHRLSTVMNADTVVVLDSGRIIESGEPEALLRAGGAFATLAARRAA